MGVQTATHKAIGRLGNVQCLSINQLLDGGNLKMFFNVFTPHVFLEHDSQFDFLEFSSLRIHVWYNYLYIYHKIQPFSHV